ncbi:unnamed protein product [Danaus chrysippus]|uniref:(African queen) hypothetical protein n=1 Tax=Danaus chrysippus TaxID=151541 RepID=A0A8J2R5P9_9NEOP|nr:unnamed protein product [Danaus chrysippus]
MKLVNGRTIIRYQNHTFSYKGVKGIGRSRYLYCSKKDTFKYSSRLKMSKDVKLEYLKTDRGLLPYFRRHTFSFVGNKRRYLCCSKKKRGGCSAKLTIDAEGRFIKGFLQHNHQPPEYHKTKSGVYVKIGTLNYNYTILPMCGNKSAIMFENYTYSYHVRGGRTLQCSKKLSMQYLKFEVIRVSKVKRPLLLVQNYTFAQTTSDFRYWNCSRKSRKCGARLRFDNHGRLVFSSLDHNHVAPLYFKQPNGLHVRVR